MSKQKNQQNQPNQARSGPARWAVAALLLAASVAMVPSDFWFGILSAWSDNPYRSYGWILAMPEIWPGEYAFYNRDTYHGVGLTILMLARVVAFIAAAVLIATARRNPMRRIAVIVVGGVVAAAFLLSLTGNAMVPMCFGIPVAILGGLAGLALILASVGNTALTRACRPVAYIAAGAIFTLAVITTQVNYGYGMTQYTWWETLSREGLAGFLIDMERINSFVEESEALGSMLPLTFTIAALLVATACLSSPSRAAGHTTESTESAESTDKPNSSAQGPFFATAIMPNGSHHLLPVTDVHTLVTTPYNPQQVVPVDLMDTETG